jgi:hypothetical protein
MSPDRVDAIIEAHRADFHRGIKASAHLLQELAVEWGAGKKR